MTAAGLQSSDAAGIDYEKLARILGMLGSSHDGEALAAARAAEKIRSSAGLVWSDILRPPALPDPPKRRASAPKSKAKKAASSKPSTAKPRGGSGQQSGPPFDLSRASGIAAAVDYVLAVDVANQWERGFLASIRQWPTPISEKQEETLVRLVEKGRRAREGAA